MSAKNMRSIENAIATNINAAIFMTKLQSAEDEYITEITLVTMVVNEIVKSRFVDSVMEKVLGKLAVVKAGLTDLDQEDYSKDERVHTVTPIKTSKPTTSRSEVSRSSSGRSGSVIKSKASTLASSDESGSEDAQEDVVSQFNSKEKIRVDACKQVSSKSSNAEKKYNSRLHGIEDTKSSKALFKRLDKVLDAIKKEFINVPKNHRVELCDITVDELAPKLKAKGLEDDFVQKYNLPNASESGAVRCAMYILGV